MIPPLSCQYPHCVAVLQTCALIVRPKYCKVSVVTVGLKSEAAHYSTDWMHHQIEMVQEQTKSSDFKTVQLYRVQMYSSMHVLYSAQYNSVWNNYALLIHTIEPTECLSFPDGPFFIAIRKTLKVIASQVLL